MSQSQMTQPASIHDLLTQTEDQIWAQLHDPPTAAQRRLRPRPTTANSNSAPASNTAPWPAPDKHAPGRCCGHLEPAAGGTRPWSQAIGSGRRREPYARQGGPPPQGSPAARAARTARTVHHLPHP